MMVKSINGIGITRYFFIVICIFGALYFTTRCIYEYTLDKDTSSVSYKKFHADSDSLYPSVSLCFADTFGDDIGEDEKIKYREFLSGCEDNPDCVWNSTYANIDYDRVTKDLLDYIIGELIVFEDKVEYSYIYGKSGNSSVVKDGKKKTIFNAYKGGDRVYTSKRGPEYKCITFDIPFRKEHTVKTYSILLNNDAFGEKLAPLGMDFAVSFHYPNQISRKTSSKVNWKGEKSLFNQTCHDDPDNCAYYGKSFAMQFEVGHVSVLKRRNKRNDPCIENWKNDSTELKTRYANIKNCKPNHWKLPLNLTLCNDQARMRGALGLVESPDIAPCTTIERFGFSYNAASGLIAFNNGNDRFVEMFDIDWKSPNIEIKAVSEIAIHFYGRQSIYLQSIVLDF